MIMKWIFAVVFWVAWIGSVFLPVLGQNTFNNLAVKTNLIVRGEQFTNMVMTPRMFGAVGDGVADDTVAFQACVTASRGTGNPIHVPAGIYRLTDTIDTRGITAGARDDSFGGIIGAGKNKVIIRSENKTAPIFRATGRYQVFSGFTVEYDSPADETETSASVFTFEDWIFFCRFSDLVIRNGFRGFNNIEGDLPDTANVFSCTFEDLRFQNHIDVAVSHVNGSGNAWRNIYMSNQSVDAVRRMIEINGGADIFTQLNLEHSNIRDCAFAWNNSQTAQIDRLHTEGLRLYSFGSAGDQTGAMLYTSARGAVRINSWWMDKVYVGPQIVTSLTASGTTVTATADDLDSDVVGGHGFRVGDEVTISGATDALYNGVFTVTSITLTEFTYEAAGSPASPAVLDTGRSWFSAQLGIGVEAGFLVAPVGQAENCEIDGLYIRDTRVTSGTSALRSTGFRFWRENDGTGFPFRLTVKNMSKVGQPVNARAWQTLNVVGRSRDGATATIHLAQPHALEIGVNVGVQNMASGGYNLAFTPVTGITSPFSFQYALVSSVEALTNETTGIVVISLVEGVGRERTSNVATITTSAAHGLKRGMRIRTYNMGGTGYSATETVVQSTPTTVTFTYLNTGADEAFTAITSGGVMLYDQGISPSTFSLPTDSNSGKSLDWLWQRASVPAFGTVAAASTATWTLAVPGARVGALVSVGQSASSPAGVTPITGRVVANDVITLYVSNITGSPIDVPAQFVTLQFVNP